MAERLLGHVGVDSGIIAVGDPCYLVAGGSPRDPDWQEVVAQMFDAGNPRRIEGTSAVEVEATVMTTTPDGDGLYPVYAEVRDGQIVSLRIDLSDPS
jgi:hypothetical protein